MVYISPKNNHRPRLQFTIRPELHERYEDFLLQAKANQMSIDFNYSFEEWLRKQLDQAEEKLVQLKIQSSLPVPSSSDNQNFLPRESNDSHILHKQQCGE